MWLKLTRFTDLLGTEIRPGDLLGTEVRPGDLVDSGYALVSSSLSRVISVPLFSCCLLCFCEDVL